MARPALEAGALARMKAGRHGAPATADDPGRNSAQGGRVSAQIAQLAGVSKDTAKDRHAVQVQGSPQLKEAVDREAVAISDAARVARHQPPDQQTEVLERVRNRGQLFLLLFHVVLGNEKQDAPAVR